MNKKSGNQVWMMLALATSVCFSTTRATAQAQGQIQDTYKYQIKGSFKLQSDCEVSGKTVRSVVKLYLAPNSLNSDEQVIPAYVKLKVCSLAGFVRDAIPISIPIRAIRSRGSLPVGSSQVIPMTDSRLAIRFPKGDGPDQMVIQKKAEKGKIDVFEIQMVEQRTGQTRIGPIRLLVDNGQSLAKISKFNDLQHLPLAGIEIEIPEAGVTLKSTLIEVGSENIDD